MTTLPPDIVALVREIAPAHGLDAAFVGALVLCESGGDPLCISPNPAAARQLVAQDGWTPWEARLESSDLGLLQINPAQVLRDRNAPAAWRHLQACDLLIPRLNLDIGCHLLRWWVYEAARTVGLSNYPTLPGDTPDYSRFPAWVATLTPADRARLYYRAALAYTWPASLGSLRGTPAVKIAHADRIVRTWLDLTGATP
jgi:hypothetical protein